MTSWTDKTGRILEVIPAVPDRGDPGRLVIQPPGTALHPVAFWLDGSNDLAEMAVAMFTANGQPAPVILERPEVNPAASANLGSYGVWLAEDGDVVFAFGNSATDLDPDGALKVAALIAAYAEVARSRRREQAQEPDPADVELLAGLITDTGPPCTYDQITRLAAHLLRSGVRLPEAGDA